MRSHAGLLSRRAALAGMTTLLAYRGEPADAQIPARVRVAGPANDGFRAVYYGVRSGIFRRYQLDVQPILVQNGSAAIAALVGGSAEVAYTNVLTVIQAYRRGIQMRIISPATLNTSERPTSTETLVLKSSPIKTGKDLNGKVLGTIALGDLAAVSTLAWVDETGGDSKTVRVIEVPVSAVVQFLETGRADAVSTIEPAVSQAIAGGNVRVLTRPFDAIAKHFQSGAYVVMEPNAVKNADAMSRFARALHDAQVYTNSHLTQTTDLVSSYSGVPVDVIAHSIRMIDPEYVDPKNLQPVIDVLARYGQLDKAFPASELISSLALKPR